MSLPVSGDMQLNTICWFDLVDSGCKLTTADAGGEVAMTSGLGPLTLSRHNHLNKIQLADYWVVALCIFCVCALSTLCCILGKVFPNHHYHNQFRMTAGLVWVLMWKACSLKFTVMHAGMCLGPGSKGVRVCPAVVHFSITEMPPGDAMSEQGEVRRSPVLQHF